MLSDLTDFSTDQERPQENIINPFSVQPGIDKNYFRVNFRVLERSGFTGIIDKEDFKLENYGKNLPPTYLCLMKKSGYFYRGQLNKIFEKDGFGILSFPNNDFFMGKFKGGKRNIRGIYIFSPIEEEGRVKQEFFMGGFNDDDFDIAGYYTWVDFPSKYKKVLNSIDSEKDGVSKLKKPKEESREKFNEILDSSSISVFIGEMEQKTFKRGLFFNHSLDGEYRVYYGNYPDDEEGMLYIASKDIVLIGKVIDMNFENGRIFFFDQDGNYIDNDKFIYDKKDKEFRHAYKKNEENVEEKIHTAKIFRNKLIEVDYFSALLLKYIGVRKYPEKKELKTLNVFKGKDYFYWQDKISKFNNKFQIYKSFEKDIYGVEKKFNFNDK